MLRRPAPPRPWPAAPWLAALGFLVLGAVAPVQAGPSADRWDGPWEVQQAPGASVDRDHLAVEWVLIYTLGGVIALVLVYTARHYTFTLSRLFGRQRHPYALVDEAPWPSLTVVVPAHNEEAVIGSSLEALLAADYPADKLTIVPLDDRSTDRTASIIGAYALDDDRVRPFYRTGGRPGKAAALRDVTAGITSDVVLVFDADYVPGPDLLKRLAAPFADPEVGAVMGRVVPLNTGRNLLTRLLDLERTGGYQVDQQARANLGLVPQYGGTVGGVRREALEAVGGWRETALSEDTDATFRLLAGGWKVAYANRAECYEESPETWPVRIRQIRRWARGHTNVAGRLVGPVLRARHLSVRERLDGALLLGLYLMSPLVLLGWAVATALFYLGAHPLHGFVAALAVASYNTLGNFAAFFEIATGARLDGSPHRVRLLPLNLLGFAVSLVATSRAVASEVLPGERFRWDKTERFREDAPTAPSGVAAAPPRPAPHAAPHHAAAPLDAGGAGALRTPTR